MVGGGEMGVGWNAVPFADEEFPIGVCGFGDGAED